MEEDGAEDSSSSAPTAWYENLRDNNSSSKGTMQTNELPQHSIHGICQSQCVMCMLMCHIVSVCDVTVQ